MQKIVTIGDLTAITIPEEYLQELGIRIGDNAHVSIDGPTIIVESLKNKAEQDLT